MIGRAGRSKRHHGPRDAASPEAARAALRQQAHVGSTNLNIASWIGNYELDVAIENDAFARTMQDMFESDLTLGSPARTPVGAQTFRA